jgi:hypothetical protein
VEVEKKKVGMDSYMPYNALTHKLSEITDVAPLLQGLYSPPHRILGNPLPKFINSPFPRNHHNNHRNGITKTISFFGTIYHLKVM